MEKEMQNGQAIYVEELIPIQDFVSAETLKEQIRKRIGIRNKSNWLVHKISNQGPFISLVFKH